MTKAEVRDIIAAILTPGVNTIPRYRPKPGEEWGINKQPRMQKKCGRGHEVRPYSGPGSHTPGTSGQSGKVGTRTRS